MVVIADKEEDRRALERLLDENIGRPFVEIARYVLGIVSPPTKKPSTTPSVPINNTGTATPPNQGGEPESETYSVVEVLGLSAFLGRLRRCSRRAVGIGEVAEALIEAPTGGRVVACWLRVDEYSLLVFVDEGFGVLYGIVVVVI